MVLETIRGGGWSGRAIAQRTPRVSKLGLKGLSGYYSNEIAVEAARRGVTGLNERATLTKHLIKKGEMDNSCKPIRIQGKRQSAREKHNE
jgi:hypothetical protein